MKWFIMFMKTWFPDNCIVTEDVKCLYNSILSRDSGGVSYPSNIMMSSVFTCNMRTDLNTINILHDYVLEMNCYN